MKRAFVIGYDPGGNNSHGVAALEVHKDKARWSPVSELRLKAAGSVREAAEWPEGICRGAFIVAAGLDTLTEWGIGPGGWRPADRWLIDKYRETAKSVVSPNALFGSMAVNGAAFLTLFAPRFESDGTMITEAHPKVCYFALTGKKHVWADYKSEMTNWLLMELGIDAADDFGRKDDCFDAAVALLAALRGLNRDWTLDLHALPNGEDAGRVQFFGQTHFWWPEARAESPRRRK